MTFAIVPIKRFAAAKQRLKPAIAPAVRRELAVAMAGDVLAAISAIDGVGRVIVVSGEPSVLTFAAATRAVTVTDRRDAGQSAAAQLGIRHAMTDGASRVLLLPGDCPALDPLEVGELLREAPSPGVTVIPDRHGTGTNGLLLDPPRVITPAFGPGSCERHRELARVAGYEARVASLHSLGLDVDTRDDLSALLSALDALPAGVAPRTREVLERFSPRAA